MRQSKRIQVHEPCCWQRVILGGLCLALFLMLTGCGAESSAPPGMEEPVVIQSPATATPENAQTPDEEAPDESDTLEEGKASEEPDPEQATETAEGEETGETVESQTINALAETGQEVYADECARCHGEEGQGEVAPAIMGESASLSEYGDGLGLFEYVSSAMPQDAPVSLSEQQYLEVVSLLLLENGFAEQDHPVEEPSDLSDIDLE